MLEVTSFIRIIVFLTDKRYGGWLVAAFLIQHAPAVIPCRFAVLMSVCVCDQTRDHSDNMKVHMCNYRY